MAQAPGAMRLAGDANFSLGFVSMLRGDLGAVARTLPDDVRPAFRDSAVSTTLEELSH